jgi:hypothetical protein
VEAWAELRPHGCVADFCGPTRSDLMAQGTDRSVEEKP